jgi:hypothetical protein
MRLGWCRYEQTRHPLWVRIRKRSLITAGGQVGVGAVLDVLQPGPVGEEPGVVTGHGQTPLK